MNLNTEQQFYVLWLYTINESLKQKYDYILLYFGSLICMSLPYLMPSNLTLQEELVI